MADDYQPAEYWSDRLAEVGGLRSTGHVGYGEAYNRWLYRRKGQVLARALRRVGQIDRALDLGSGVGWVVEQLESRGVKDIHGVDISSSAVAQLRQRFPSYAFDEIRLGEQPLPVEDSTIDCVTFLDVAYHMVDDGLWEQAVAEIGRALRPGGSLIVIDAFGPTEVRPAAHVRFRSAGRWHGVARASGLEAVTTIPCYRWLSRPRNTSGLRHLPETARAVIELVLDTVLPRPSHLSCVVYRRT